MKWLHIVDGVVDTVWLVPPDDPAEFVEGPDNIFPGCTYDAATGVFTPPAPAADPPAAITAPDEVDLWRVRAVLDARQRLTLVDSAITGLGDAEVSAFWQHGNSVQRGGRFLTTLGLILSYTPAQLDELLVAAAGISF